MKETSNTKGLNVVESLWLSWLRVSTTSKGQAQEIPTCVAEILQRAFLAGFQAHLTADEVCRRDLPEERARQVLADMSDDFYRYCHALKIDDMKRSN